MEIKISDRMNNVSGSLIREILRLANDPAIIAFGGGNPAVASFPVKEIAEIAARAVAEDPVAMLQYGLSEGYLPLRETLKKKLIAEENFDFENNDIAIVTGGQQAADLTAKLLLNEGDTVISENPTFTGCVNGFLSYNAKVVGVDMEPDGMNLEKLEHAIKTSKNVKLIYTIPSFQNPTGYTTSLEKRKGIYQLAQKYDLMILEDNPYGELCFEGDPIPTIKSFDTDCRVIYAGSFSKVMAPALRVAFIVFEKSMFHKVSVAKQCSDVHTATLPQHICYEFMTRYDYQGHIEGIKQLYKHKANLMLSEMDKKFNPAVKYSRPKGGLFIMAFLPEGNDTLEFVKEGIENGIACVPGIAFACDTSKPSNSFRMNYSAPSDENIVKGVDILARLIDKRLAK